MILDASKFPTVGELYARQRGKSAETESNARLFRDRDVMAISELIRRNPEEARRAALVAGENPDVWLGTNPR